MKPTTYILSVILSLIVLALCALPGHATAAGTTQIKIAMTPDHWEMEGAADFVQHMGIDSIELKPGNAASHITTGQVTLKDISFRNGTIEFDTDPTGTMGAGIGFRRRDKDTYEDFYLRPRADCSVAPDCTQYAPVTHGILLWDLFPQYQSPAPLRQGEWNHVKLVVSGQRMNVFINGSKLPTLKIGRLEGDSIEGGILLQGPGIFSNVTVTPNATEGLSPSPESDPTASDQHFVRNWHGFCAP